jgi:hypothetical protein
MRSIDYARTPPEAPKALVLVVHFAVVIIGGAYERDRRWRQLASLPKITAGPVEQDGLLTR